MDKEYVVTLHRKEDLEQFYNEMQLTNFPLVLKRPLSRNTHYMMTEEQAEQLRQDSRVWGVEPVDGFHVRTRAINNESYTISGTFWKDSSSVGSSINPSLLQWGHLHCAGSQAQRRKGIWGDGTSTEQVSDSVEVFNNGRHVDVVIVDDPVSYDNGEWYSTTDPGTNRFVQYQWFNELNTIVNSIDDDNQSEPTGNITYHAGNQLPSGYYHGNHVTGTTAGRSYGWAREANIYNLAVTGSWQSGQSVGALLIFDYLRAFHLNKPINPETGVRNPTVTNHSYGGVIFMPNENLTFADVTSVTYQGVTYSAGNPPAGGWTQQALEFSFGVRFGYDVYPSWSASVAADVQDAIEDGVVIIGAAGNDNLLMAEVGDENWDNILNVSGVGSFYYNRGGWPNTPDSGSILVGALQDRADFRRSTYTNFGPSIDVFSPGDNILSSYSSAGFPDTKQTNGSGNYYYPISGTSMASPQVCGIAACLATGKRRFENKDVLGFLNKKSIDGDMTFDVSGGSYTDNSCRKGSPNRYLHIENPRELVGYIEDVKGDRTTGMTFPRRAIYFEESIGPKTFTIDISGPNANEYIVTGEDRNGSFTSQSNYAINVNAGDIINFILAANMVSHPLWIKTSPTTGTGNGVTTGTITPSNGRLSGTMAWDTSGVAAGTYYYQCQYHGGMYGTIIVS